MSSGGIPPRSSEAGEDTDQWLSMTATTTVGSMEHSQQLPMTASCDGQLPTTAVSVFLSSVCLSSVRLSSVCCRSTLVNGGPDQSTDQQLPTTATTTVGTTDNGGQQLPATASQWTSTQTMDNDCGSQSLDQRFMDKHRQPPTTADPGQRLPMTATTTVGSMDNGDQLPTTLSQWTSTRSMDNDGSQSLDQWITDERRSSTTYDCGSGSLATYDCKICLPVFPCPSVCPLQV